MILLSLLTLFQFGPVNASLIAERRFYENWASFFQTPVAAISKSTRLKIDRLGEGDITGYARLVLEAWTNLLPTEEKRVVRRAFGRLRLESTDDPNGLIRGNVDHGETPAAVGLEMPAVFDQSILFYWVGFHELEHLRQGRAFYEGTGLDLAILGPEHFVWGIFEQEKSAMSVEWFFIHHAPSWVKTRLTSELLIVPNREQAGHFGVSLLGADLTLEAYLELQWQHHRYSWPSLVDACSRMLI